MKSKLIGLTGHTGAGKSTAARAAADVCGGIIDADQVAREALQKGSPCLKALAAVFGEDILQRDGSLDRRLLAKRAFSSQEKTLLLNRTTHPWILRRVQELAEEFARHTDKLVLFDAPLLYESGGETLCDSVIAVVAPDAVRLQRILLRDRISEEEARLRMNAQPDASFYTSRADYVIDGSQPPERVAQQMRELLKRLCIPSGSTDPAARITKEVEP